jgi:hypothetical protein
MAEGASLALLSDAISLQHPGSIERPTQLVGRSLRLQPLAMSLNMSYIT